MASRSYNCTILWKIENFYTRLPPPPDFCVPIAEVETFNSEKWKLELNLREEVGSKVCKMSLKILKLSGDLGMPTERRASVVNKAGNVELSVGNSRKQPESEREMLFIFYYPYEDYFQDGHIGLKIELGFLVDDLALSTTVRTVFKTETCSFHWSLKNISKGFNALEYPIPVHIPGFHELTLLFLQRKGYLTGDSYHLGLNTSNDVTRFLESECYPAGHMYVSYNIKGSINLKMIDVSSFKELTSTSKVWELIPIALPEHVDLKCMFCFCDGTSESLQLETVYSSLHSDKPVVMEKFHAGESLFKNMNFFDVTLKAGNKQFKAHRSVLSSASPVFGAMFENEMSETVTGVVNIEDVEPNTLKKMLKFIYTGETGDWSFNQYEKLLAAAHKYSISSLRDLCSHRLVSLLTEKNVIGVLHLGYLYNDERLKSAAKSLFSMNPSLILDSKEWNGYIGDCFPNENGWLDSFAVDKMKKSLQTIKGKASSIVPPSVSKLFKKQDEKDTEEG